LVLAGRRGTTSSPCGKKTRRRLVLEPEEADEALPHPHAGRQGGALSLIRKRRRRLIFQQANEALHCPLAGRRGSTLVPARENEAAPCPRPRAERRDDTSPSSPCKKMS
ncbi:hypothetical protein GW17_00061100, partial [Ensete ventricosum]